MPHLKQLSKYGETQHRQLKHRQLSKDVMYGKNELRQLTQYYKHFQGLPDIFQANMNYHTLKNMYILIENSVSPCVEKRGARNKGSIWNDNFIKGFHYEVDDNIVGQTKQFVVHETFNGISTNGGTSFVGEIQSENVLELCNVYDHFNGTYSFDCNIREMCAEIVISMMFPNFTAFMEYYNLLPLHRVILDMDFCIISGHKQTGYKSGNFKNSEGNTFILKHLDNFPVYGKEEDLWLKVNGSWVWSEKGVIYTEPESKVLQKCLQNYTSLLFLGNSHMRELFLYIRSLVGIKLVSNFTFAEPINEQNMKFRFVYYILNMNSILQNMIRDIHGVYNKNDIIVFSSGAWDTAFKTAASYIIDINIMVKTITQLCKNNRCTNKHIIWLTDPPYPFKRLRPVMTHRNNFFRQAAAHAYSVERIRSVDIYLIDVLNIVQVRSAETSFPGHDTVHYLLYDKLKRKSTGAVGYIPILKLLNYICEW